MALTPGTRLGVYDIIAAIGEGGMGAVFRARDTKLARDVAIKVLPEAFAHDADRLARFEREAKTLASLNHPHIAAIYAIEQSAGATALVMELVEGEDLSQRIAQGAIPVDEALPIAKQIAEALEAAHEQGIIHRDLKPANIKVRPDGTVKVLDFGLAKLGQNQASGSGLQALGDEPTITSPAMTQVGMILGTAAYMSPEQARGKAVDRRADIWAFGCVLYEMLTGQRAFPGDDVTDTIVSVLSKEPDLAALPADVPARVVQALRVCLRKDAKQRVGDIRDVRLALDGAFETTAAPVAPATGAVGGRAGWVAAAVASTAALALGAAYARRPPLEKPEPPPSVRFSHAIATLNEGNVGGASSLPNPALSPDGRSLAFLAPNRLNGAPLLRIRALDGDTRTVEGTEGAAFPFWSADSRSIGFFAAGKLRRVDATGSDLRVICDAPSGQGGTWNADDTIVFSPSASDALFRVSGRGGTPAKVTTLDAARQERGHTSPVFLPDGEHVLYYSAAPDGGAVYVASLDTGATTRVVASTSGAQYSSGYLLYVVGGELVARAFDPISHALGADEVSLAPRMRTTSLGAAAFAVSAGGTLAYRTATQTAWQIVWFDRSGNRGAVLGESGPWVQLALTPDDRQLAAQFGTGPTSDLWLFDVARAVGSRLTLDGNNNGPVWSPDGRELAYRSNRRVLNEVFRLSLATNTASRWDGVPSERLEDWSRDGRYVVLGRAGDGVPIAVPLTGDRTPIPLAAVAPGENVDESQFSPDSRWLSYNLVDVTGRSSIYLQPFPGPGQRITASVGGGVQAKWRADGRELFYLSPDGTMMAVDVRPGDPIALGTPRPLFKTRIAQPAGNVDQYVVTRDGQRFLILEPSQSVEPQSLTIITNWTNLLKK